MNILILTAKFGLGHVKTAESLRDKIKKENPNSNVIVIDFIEYIFPRLNKSIYCTFNFLVDKCHTIYNTLNVLAPSNNAIPLKSVVIKRIDTLIRKYKINKIISVVPICSEYMSFYIKMTGTNIPLITFITDIEVHSSWINPYTSFYFVPSKETKEYLLNKNISENKILVSGIPVNKEFNSYNNYNKKKVLIMGGGLGLIPKVNKLLNFLDKNKEVTTTIILGNNKKLYDKIKTKYKNINVLGYTSDVYKYMRGSNLVITKSGCVTMFEAIYSLTPLLIIKPFLVQEVGNAKFIEKNKIGKVIWKNQDVVSEILYLLNNKEELDKMKSNMIYIKQNIENFNFMSNLEVINHV